MKPRILKTTKLLAVALTTPGGCAEGPAVTKPAADTSRVEAPAATQAPVASAQPEAPAERSMSKDPALLALAEDLATGGKEQALAQAARFRAICDADGYPLVGNVMRKDARYQPSAFCATVREKKGAR
jgi:hypothetical protein